MYNLRSRRKKRLLKYDNSINLRGNGRVKEVFHEPITEPLLFEGQVIYPCCCILPLITDAEVKGRCRRAIRVSKIFQPNRSCGRSFIRELSVAKFPFKKSLGLKKKSQKTEFNDRIGQRNFT